MAAETNTASNRNDRRIGGKVMEGFGAFTIHTRLADMAAGPKAKVVAKGIRGRWFAWIIL